MGQEPFGIRPDMFSTPKSPRFTCKSVATIR